MQINIDANAGFCWGVVRTVEKVEEWLDKVRDEDIYILGQIIHNPHETGRLEDKGLKTINHDGMKSLPPKAKVIFRAHGEPPSTYELAESLGLEVIDATCPLVVALQKRVKIYHKQGYQIVIFGKKDHAEVVGLRGFCDDECIVIKSLEEAIEKVDLNRKTILLSQTTMYKPAFFAVKEALESKACELVHSDEIAELFQSKNTLCKYVSDREEILQKFAHDNDVLIFVAGKNSSNGKSLHKICKNANEATYFIEDVNELDYNWVKGADKVGITGATSTPQWYLSLVKSYIEKNVS